VSNWWRPASRRKSCSASVVVSSGWAGGGAFSGGEQLDAPPVELLIDGLGLERIELERLQDLDQLDLSQLAARLRRLEQRCELFADENRLELDRGQYVPLNRRFLDVRSRLSNLPKHARPPRVKSSAR
jgi:hypothetical protein